MKYATALLLAAAAEPAPPPPLELDCWQNGVRVVMERNIRSVDWLNGLPITLRLGDGSTVQIVYGTSPLPALCLLRRPGK